MKRIFQSNSIQLFIWLFVLQIGFIAFPLYLFSINDKWDNTLTRVLFSVLLSISSVLVGLARNTKEIERRVTGKWIPAAEMVSNELLTMTATIERMCRKQSNVSQSLKKRFPNTPDDTMAPIEDFIGSRCGYCSEKLEDLKNHIENSCLNWDVFIGANGEQSEVDSIRERLKERKTTLFAAIERDFPSEPTTARK